MVGIRTPWTLTSDLSWDRTHRVGGRLFVLEGIVFILLGAGPPRAGALDRRPDRRDRAHARRPLRAIHTGSGRPTRRGARHDDRQLLLLLTPVIVIELVLIVFALRDLLRPERRVRGNSKLMWGIVIVFISLLGPIIYLAVGTRGGMTEAGPGDASPVAGWPSGSAGRRGVLAVDGLDLDVPAGSVFGLLGPNGAGKTTTLRLITGLARPTAGVVTIDERAGHRRRRPGRRPARHRRPRPGPALLRLDDRARARRLRGAAPGARGARGRGRADETLELVGLARREDAPDRRLFGWHAPAARDRPGARRAAAAADPRRAGQLARPGGPARPAGAHRRGPGERDGHLLDPRPRRRRADLRPGRRSSTTVGW